MRTIEKICRLVNPGVCGRAEFARRSGGAQMVPSWCPGQGYSASGDNRRQERRQRADPLPAITYGTRDEVEGLWMRREKGPFEESPSLRQHSKGTSGHRPKCPLFMLMPIHCCRETPAPRPLGVKLDTMWQIPWQMRHLDVSYSARRRLT